MTSAVSFIAGLGIGMALASGWALYVSTLGLDKAFSIWADREAKRDLEDAEVAWLESIPTMGWDPEVLS